MQTIPFSQFCGKDSTPFSTKADAQQLMCLYRETIQSGDNESQSVLYKTPGLQLRTTFGACHRGTLQLNNFLFEVVDASILLLDSTFAIGAANTFGPIANDGKPVILAANFDTFFCVSAGTLYALNSAALTTPLIPAACISVAVIDTYVVILSAYSQIFFSVDGLIWDPLDFQTIEGSPGLVIAMIVDHNELWLIGNRITQVYTVGSDPNAPFVPRQDAIIQQGIAAASSLVALADALLWIGRNKNGERTIVMTNGYQPSDVSTYAQNDLLRRMSTVDDAIGMSFQLGGHHHVWFTFPTANQTIGYDVDENDWYKVGFWNGPQGKYERHRANTIVSAFGVILVGDWQNGNLYQLSPDFYDDSGLPIRWLRQTPHFTQLGKRVSYSRLDLFGETGNGVENRWLNNRSMTQAAFTTALNVLVFLGTVSAAQAAIMQLIFIGTFYDTSIALPPASVMTPLGFYAWGNNPQVSMRFSDDWGNNFSSVFSRSMGKLGKFLQRMFWARLGTAYDRVFQFYGTDPVKIAFTGATFDAEILGANTPNPTLVRSV